MISRKDEYVLRYPERRRLWNKLAWIKKLHGAKAKRHFIEHHVCDRCGEPRIAALAIHHRYGKRRSVFITLCHNCHAVEHSHDKTFEDCARGTTADPDLMERQLELLEEAA